MTTGTVNAADTSSGPGPGSIARVGQKFLTNCGLTLRRSVKDQNTAGDKKSG